MRALDTTRAAFETQIGVYSRMEAKERLGIGLELTTMGRKLLADGIRSRHPEYTEEMVRAALLLVWLGPELFRAAYPDLPEMDP